MNAKADNSNWLVWYAVVAVIGVFLVQDVLTAWRQTETIPYSQFESLVRQGSVAEVTVGPETISGALKEPSAEGRRFFVAKRVDPALAERLIEKGIVVKGSGSGGILVNLLSWLVPVLAFYLIWAFLISRVAERQGLGGLMAIGKSKAKIFVETDTKVTFKDVAGVDEAKFELQETVAFLKDPKAFARLGARAPKGILLVGPPGTGKTLLARAVAGEAGVKFFSISGAQFIEMFVGVGAARVRDLFEQARKAAPAIIFIDELDSLGRSRAGIAVSGGYDEREQTVNQLLAELDGFDPSAGVILLAATNRPEVLDPALLRPGRFDRQVLVDRPDRKGRLDILKVHVRKVKLAPDLDLDQVAAITIGFTGADLANLVNEAAIFATRRGAEMVTFDDFTQAIERIVAGIEKRSRILSPEEKRRVAFHEIGHALVAASLPGTDPVLKVSIIPRGIGALGYTIQRPTQDRFLITASELRGRLTVLMGGRAAEALLFGGDVSTGAADDLQRATEIALDMVTRHGMSTAVGQRTYLPPANPFLLPGGSDRPNASEGTEREIDLAVRDLVAAAFAEATEILQSRRPDLEAGARLLLQKETITAEDFPVLAAAETKAAQAQGAPTALTGANRARQSGAGPSVSTCQDGARSGFR